MVGCGRDGGYDVPKRRGLGVHTKHIPAPRRSFARFTTLKHCGGEGKFADRRCLSSIAVRGLFSAAVLAKEGGAALMISRASAVQEQHGPRLSFSNKGQGGPMEEANGSAEFEGQRPTTPCRSQSNIHRFTSDAHRASVHLCTQHRFNSKAAGQGRTAIIRFSRLANPGRSSRYDESETVDKGQGRRGELRC